MSKRNLKADFKKFDKKNPFIYRQFKMYAQELLKKGVPELSGDFIMHRVRWENVNLATQRHNVRISNNHVPYYVRKLIKNNPRMASRFQMRATRGE